MGAAARSAILLEGMIMDLFSCRNCIHNPAQGLTLGQGPGYCLQWGSIIEQPEQTTCKYLHRKDLPIFLVQQAVQEHADEFSICRGMADLETREPIVPTAYDERDFDQTEHLDLTTRAVADHYALSAAPDATPARRARLIPMFAGSSDARRTMAHASLVRRAMRGDLPPYLWTRRVLDLAEEVDGDFTVYTHDLVKERGLFEEETRVAAVWEVVYTRLSGLQEYGWHVSIEDLKYPMQELGRYAANQDWEGLRARLRSIKEQWYEAILLANTRDKLSGWPDPPEEIWSAPDPRFRLLLDESVQEGAANTFRRILN